MKDLSLHDRDTPSAWATPPKIPACPLSFASAASVSSFQRSSAATHGNPQHRRLTIPIPPSIPPTMLMDYINPPIRRCTGIVRRRNDLPPIPDLMDGVASLSRQGTHEGVYI
jgi:hypothetical protein